jgi:hypothetical protein
MREAGIEASGDDASLAALQESLTALVSAAAGGKTVRVRRRLAIPDSAAASLYANAAAELRQQQLRAPASGQLSRSRSSGSATSAGSAADDSWNLGAGDDYDAPNGVFVDSSSPRSGGGGPGAGLDAAAAALDPFASVLDGSGVSGGEGGDADDDDPLMADDLLFFKGGLTAATASSGSEATAAAAPATAGSKRPRPDGAADHEVVYSSSAAKAARQDSSGAFDFDVARLAWNPLRGTYVSSESSGAAPDEAPDTSESWRDH